ncbi:facilitated trehalose transporter Tret1-like [Chrysoperla carnea]|uniref:facilitated trehalose transporter Tret1-like n=1 Tax=Chrysoperla carnea TaxID=189513 RepID=UPI001D0826A6|nr:facilitated trehalose transporter Tret1-like [Chrysoperla carnea]
MNREDPTQPCMIPKKKSYVNLENPDAKPIRGSSFRQVIAAFIANLGTVNTGLVFGFSAVAIPQLEAKDSIIPIDEYQASWIASLSSVTTPIGCILSGYLMDNFGRKPTLILTEIPLILGWFLISIAQDITMIYIGRLLVGLGSGMVGAPARVYTCEVTQPHLRGMLGALASVGISLGVLAQYTLGSILAWKTLAAVSAVVPIVALLLMLMVPETPSYLLSNSKSESARESLKRLRASACNVTQEVEQMQLFREKNNCKRLQTWNEIFEALKKPSTMKPFFILTFYFLMYQFSGVNIITFYAVEIFQKSGVSINKYLATIILGVTRVIFTIVGCISLRKYGRRPLTFISCIGCGLTMLGLGTYMFFLDKWTSTNTEPILTWIPLACILLFTTTCTVGFLVVPWVMIGEVYPQEIRGIVGGMTTCCAHMSIFVVVKTYPMITHLIYRYGAFWVYGCISLLGTIVLYVYLPETKGKTLQEIEDYFCGRTESLKNNNKKNTLLTVPKGELLP